MIKVGKVSIDDTVYNGNDLYSDGTVEDELLEIVKKYEKSRYNQIIEEKASWPIMYHLSELRENIVDWIEVEHDAEVLEVGSGCGAITGNLAKKAGKVTCIELSKKRSLINAYRNKEFDNIEIKLGNFSDIEKKMEQKFDYIFLIGVLEYGEFYIEAEKPYDSFIKILKGMLNEKGKLVIAIENRFGLKYWAGCKEDHFNKLYEGIEGYTETFGVKTFTKNVLENMVRGAGFDDVEFFYPYPDYKFCNTIYSDMYLPKIGELNANRRNFDSERIVTFDEAKVFDTIIKEGMFPLFSNSYLVVASKGEE